MRSFAALLFLCLSLGSSVLLAQEGIILITNGGGGDEGTIYPNGTTTYSGGFGGVGSGPSNITVTGSLDASTLSAISALNVNNVTVASTASYNLPLDTATPNTPALVLSGTLVLNSPTLVLTNDSDVQVTPGTVYNLISYSGAETGTFTFDGNPLPNLSDFTFDGDTFQIDYSTGDPIVSVMVVPETSSAWLVIAASFLYAIRLGKSRARQGSSVWND